MWKESPDDGVLILGDPLDVVKSTINDKITKETTITKNAVALYSLRREKVRGIAVANK